MATVANTVGIAVGSALIGGLVGGVVVARVAAPEPLGPSREQRTAPSDDETTTPSDVAHQLEERVDEVEKRLGRLEQHRKASDALREYAQTLAKSDGSAAEASRAPSVTDAEDPAFELAVRSVLDRVDWERDEEERVTRAQQRSERAQRQTALLTERLSLSQEQAEGVAQVLNRQMERFRELRDLKGEERPATREQWRERTGAIRGETEQKLGEILDEEQMKGYRAFAEEEGLGPRDWGLRGRRERPEPPAPENP